MKQRQARTGIAHKPETKNKFNLFNDLVDLCNLQFSKDLLASGREVLDCVEEWLQTTGGNEVKFIAAHPYGNCKILPDFFAKIYEKIRAVKTNLLKKVIFGLKSLIS